MCNTFDLRVIVNDDGCRIFRLYIINLVPKNVCEQWTKIDSFGFDSTNKNIDKIWKCLDSNLSIINCCYTLNCLDKNLLDYDIRTRQFIFPFISQEISVIIENYSKFEKYVEKHLKKYILTKKIEHYSCRYKEFLKLSSLFLLTKKHPFDDDDSFDENVLPVVINKKKSKENQKKKRKLNSKKENRLIMSENI